MKGFYAYQVHQALNLHFDLNSEYNAFKYKFKTRNTIETLKKSPFKWQYVGVENNTDNVLYSIYCVFEQNNFKWVVPKQLFTQARNYDENHRISFLDDTLKKDLTFLKKAYNQVKVDMFLNDENYPLLYTHYIKNEISLRTLILLDMYVYNFLREDNSKDIVSWSKFIEQVKSIRPFLQTFYSRETFDEYLGTSLFDEKKSRLT